MIVLTLGYIVYLHSIEGLAADLKEVGIKTHDDLKAWGINKISFNFTNINKRSLIHEQFDENQSEEPTRGTPYNETISPQNHQTDSQEYTETL